MAELNTITLSELEVLSDIEDTDYVLVERSGRMKRVEGSQVGGSGVCVINLDDYMPSSGEDDGENNGGDLL